MYGSTWALQTVRSVREPIESLERTRLSHQPTAALSHSTAEQNLLVTASPENMVGETAGIENFAVLKGIAAPLHTENVDTDVPQLFLRTLTHIDCGIVRFYLLQYRPKLCGHLPHEHHAERCCRLPRSGLRWRLPSIRTSDTACQTD